MIPQHVGEIIARIGQVEDLATLEPLADRLYHELFEVELEGAARVLPVDLLNNHGALAYLARQAGISEEFAKKRLKALVGGFGPDAAVIYADLHELGDEVAGWR
ncbi:MAG: hypothetical protein A4E45_01768 [Methanosaeta sp. PtaB.Bin039]|nr:MAG: hypothetical protein A4E45_01768 [Methanosaeta sp. PtaB.Bin039]